MNDLTEKVGEQLNKTLHGEEFLSWMEEKVTPVVLPKMEEFAKANAHKAKEYINNPELLEKDFEQFTGWMNKADWILDVVDILLIIKMVTAAIATALPTAGGSLVALFSGLAGRQLLKQGLRVAAKIVFKRVVRKLSVRAFKKYAIVGGIKIAGAFAREFGYRYILYNCLTILYSAVKVGGAGTLITAQYILSKYGNEIGLPPQVVELVTDPDITSEFFTNILKDQIQSLSDHMERMLTLKGLTNLSIGAAARLLGLNGSRHILTFSENFHTLNKALQAGTITGKTLRLALERTKERTKNFVSAQEDNITFDEIERILIDRKVLNLLHSNYVENLQKIALREKGKEKQKKVVVDIVEEKKNIYPIIEENLTELATLEFLIKYNNYFSANNNSFFELLKDAIDIDVLSIEALMNQTQTTSIIDMLKVFREGKILELLGLIDRLTFGNSKNEDRLVILAELRKIYRVEEYKLSLEKLIFKKVG